MRFVIYDDETLEPITVINLPFTDRDLKRLHISGRAEWHISVPCATRVTWAAKSPDPAYVRPQSITIEFQPFYRHTRRYGEQNSWIALTRTADLAMLLEPDWLPGQRPTVQMMDRQIDLLTQLMTDAVQRGL